MSIHFDESFLTVHWDDESSLVWAQWKDTTGGEPMQRGLYAGLDVVRQKQARKWLADTNKLGTMDPADVKWVNDVWIPQVVAAGVRWMAFVAPKRVVMQLAVRSFMARIDDTELTNAYFDSLDEARTWLRAQR